jgi:RimJ/RimL family protein N-acetyltransferase
VVSCIRACWRSTDQYLHNGGIGYCLLKGEAITSWCSTDYVIGNTCELYVETFEGYRQKGLGMLTAFACVQACITQGLTVYWHCFKDNLGSVRIAEKIGFRKMAEFPIYVVDLPKGLEL